MPLFIAVLLGLAGLAVIIYPLLGLDDETAEAATGGPIAEVAEREQSARDALREVEFDHRLGNLDDADYQALRARYERRALAALKTRYQREQELDALIERQLDALRAQSAEITNDEAEPTPPTQSQLPASRSARQNDTLSSISRNDHHTPSSARSIDGPQARRRRGGRS